MTQKEARLVDIVMAITSPLTWASEHNSRDFADYFSIIHRDTARITLQARSGTLIQLYKRCVQTELGNELKLIIEYPPQVITGEREGELVDIQLGRSVIHAKAPKHLHSATPKLRPNRRALWLLGEDGKLIAEAFN